MDVSLYEIVVARVHQKHVDRPNADSVEREEHAFDLVGTLRHGILYRLDPNASKLDRGMSDILRFQNTGSGRTVSGLEDFLLHSARAELLVMIDEVGQRFLFVDRGETLPIRSDPAKFEVMAIPFDDRHHFFITKLRGEDGVDKRDGQMSREKLVPELGIVEVDHAAHFADYLPNLRPFCMYVFSESETF